MSEAESKVFKLSMQRINTRRPEINNDLQTPSLNHMRFDDPQHQALVEKDRAIIKASKEHESEMRADALCVLLAISVFVNALQFFLFAGKMGWLI